MSTGDVIGVAVLCCAGQMAVLAVAFLFGYSRGYDKGVNDGRKLFEDSQ